MMDERQARSVLGAVSGDGPEEIRRKYRALMRKVHPDNHAGENTAAIAGTQALNEAYAVLKNAAVQKPKHSVTDWEGPVNPLAFRDRQIFFSGMEHEGHSTGSFQMAEGKYLWDPENEEFEMLLRSVGLLSRQILEEIEDRFPVWKLAQEELQKRRFPYQQELFHFLMLEYVDPAICLDQLVRLWGTDGEKSIYQLSAELKREYLSGEAMQDLARSRKWDEELLPGTPLFPAFMKARRLYVQDHRKNVLGYLTFEEDWLFYTVIPLLENRIAQVKMQAAERRQKVSGKLRRTVTADHIPVELFVKLTVEESSVENSADINRKIETLCAGYAVKLAELTVR